MTTSPTLPFHGAPEGDGPVELVVFRVGGAPYALPVQQVREIIRGRRINQVPHRSPGMLGVIDLRGRVVRVFDLAQLLGLVAPVQEEAVIVVTDTAAGVTGLRADHVDSVLSLPRDAFEAAAPGSLHVAVAHRGEDLVVVLDADRLAGADELAA